MSEQIQHMQRLQLAGTLAGGIAHDLNNELTLVLGNLELALAHLPVGYDASESLEMAQTAAGRCAAISRRLLYLSRPPRHALERLDIASVIAEAGVLLECVKPAHTRLAIECEAGLFILADAMQIQQALINLGINAFQSMPGGGEVQIRAYHEAGRVNVKIGDDGCGIPRSLRQKVFEPFYSTHADTGSGLGLACVRAIVAAHDALLGFDSTPGDGTTFLISFPFAVDPALADEPLPEAA